MLKESKLALRWLLFCLLRVVVTVAPLTVVFIVKREQYFTAPGQGAKLTLGGLLCLALLFFAATGKFKMPRRVVGVAVALLLSWLFQAILTDLTVLLLAWLIGEVLDLFVAPLTQYAKEEIGIGRAARAQAEALGEALKESGRV